MGSWNYVASSGSSLLRALRMSHRLTCFTPLLALAVCLVFVLVFVLFCVLGWFVFLFLFLVFCKCLGMF